VVLPSSAGQWVIPAVLVSLLVWAVSAYAGASAEARLLDDQLRVALDSVEVVTDTLVAVRVVSDSLINAQDANEERTDSVIAVVRDSVIVAIAGTDSALRDARNAAADLPIILAALDRAEEELAEERGANELFRTTSAAEIFAGQQRERVLGMQLLTERSASDDVISGLRASLAISMQESDAWERAAKPGALTQIWKQGRAAAVAVALVLVLK
jgi:hypothetical protein